MPKARADRIGSFRETASPAIANLATTTGVLATGLTLQHGCTIVKTRLQGRFEPGAAAELLMIGIASGELTLAEIEAFLELVGPDEPDQMTECEVIARGRLIKVLGVVPPPKGYPLTADSYAFDLEESITLQLREGHSVAYWVYNMSSAALNAASAMKIWAHHVVRWAAP